MLFSLILKKGKILNIPFACVSKCLSTSIFFIFRLPNMLSVNNESLFKLSSGLSYIFLMQPLQIVTYTSLGVSQFKYDFKVNGQCQLLNLKSLPSIIWLQQKQLFTHFVVLKVDLFVEKFKEHKSLFKLDGCL